MSSPAPLSFTIPDLVSYCEFPLRINADLCEAASLEWITSACKFSEKQKRTASRMKLGTLAAMVYPDCELPDLRVCTDFMHYLFYTDDLTDAMTMDEAIRVKETIIDVLRHQYHYIEQVEAGKTSTLVNVTHDLGTRMLPKSSLYLKARLIQSLATYLEAVCQHCALRSRRASVPTIEEYILLRREEGGVRPCFALVESVNSLDLPDEIFTHPVFHDLENAANDMIVWSNVRSSSAWDTSLLIVYIRFSCQVAT
ncbi:terpenoid synthase [Calocera cornea HHB12733]|uniref:Terpene synthase n=1 Tax=Calocera cornea HHB12733 TaxID=1353952 RepID=A0A165CJ54_9BASI|nr:terpenoid synthase [Calocera cornea HHB12733]